MTCMHAESGSAGEADARRLMRDFELDDKTAVAVSLNGIDGLYIEGEDEGEYLREWYLYAGDFILLVSYSCEIEDMTMDKDIVDDILETLEIKKNTETSETTEPS